MASAPTQELPPWLSYSTTTITNTNGLPISTSVTLLELPLTYYGPSIPLGTDGVWVYGGSTSPASSSSVPSTTSSSITSVQSSSTSSSATPSSSTSPSTSLSSSSTPSSSTPSSVPSSSPSPSATSATGTSGHLRKGYIGAIVGSIIAALLLLLIAICLLRWTRNRKRRHGHELLTPPPERHSRHSRSATYIDTEVTDVKPRLPIWIGWEKVASSDPDVERDTVPPVEGEWTMVNDNGQVESGPRRSGDEHETFLRKSAYARSADLTLSNASARLVSVPSLGSGTNSGTNSSTQNSKSSSGSNSTGASGYGTVVNPQDSKFNFARQPTSQFGHIMSPAALMELVEREYDSDEDDNSIESGLRIVRRRESTILEEDEDQCSPLMPPPPLRPDQFSVPTEQFAVRAHHVSRSTASLGSLRLPETPASWDENAQLMTAHKIRVDELDRAEAREVPSPTTEASGGLFGAIGRMSWFKRNSSGSDIPRERPTSYNSRRLSVPLALVASSPEADYEVGRIVPGPDGTRPLSDFSSQSNQSTATVYYEARSRPVTPSLAQPPVAITSARSRLSQSHTTEELADSGASSSSPTVRVVPSIENPPPYEDQAKSPSMYDVLDMPAPRPTSPFSTSNTAPPVLPPGLANARSWQQSLKSLGSTGSSAGIAIDILEEEPPAAREPWRSLAGDRTTFGSVSPLRLRPRDASQSEQGSLSSMRSHLSPNSVSNPSGSAPASFIHTPESSFGSSMHSRRTHNSSGTHSHSLSHSGSVSSDGRRKRRHAGGPNVPNSFGRMSVGATGLNPSRLGSPSLRPPSPLNAQFDSLVSIPGSDLTTETRDPVTGMMIPLPRATVGRDHSPSD